MQWFFTGQIDNQKNTIFNFYKKFPHKCLSIQISKGRLRPSIVASPGTEESDDFLEIVTFNQDQVVVYANNPGSYGSNLNSGYVFALGY